MPTAPIQRTLTKWSVVTLACASALSACRIGYDILPDDLALNTGGGATGGESSMSGGAGATSVTVGGKGAGGAGGAGAGGAGGEAQGGSAGASAGDGGAAPVGPGALPSTVVTYAGTAMPGFQDGPAATATFNHPSAVLVTPEGLYVADADNAAIRLIDPMGMVSTVVGRAGPGFVDGPPSSAQLRHPMQLARDLQGRVLVADDFNHAIRRIEKDGTLKTILGTGKAGYAEGIGTAAQFNEPQGLYVDPAGVLYVADKNNRAIRRVALDGTTSLFCGHPGQVAVLDGSCAGAATFDFPTGIDADGAGNLFVTEWSSHTIRKIALDGGITTVLGAIGVQGWADGPAAMTILSHPSEVSWDAGRRVLWFLDHDGGNRLRLFDGVGATTIFGPKDAGYVQQAFRDGADPRFAVPEGMAVADDGSIYIADLGNNRIRRAYAP